MREWLKILLKKTKESKEYVSCPYIEGGLFFSFNFLSACCRAQNGLIFDNNFKGKNINWNKLKNYRLNTIKNCKKGIIPLGCEGCPDLKKKDWDSINPDKLINELFVMSWAHCNSNCVYCNQKSVGEYLLKEPKKSKFYDFYPILKMMYDKKILARNLHFEFIGGELTVLEETPKIIKLVLSKPHEKITFLTSGVMYSPEIEKAFKETMCGLTISIDCGCKETYEKIKRIDAFDEVIKNIKIYRNANKHMGLTLKYVLLEGLNDNIEEINKWLDLCKSLDIRYCSLEVDYRQFIPEYGNVRTELPLHYKTLTEYFKTKTNEYKINAYTHPALEQI